MYQMIYLEKRHFQNFWDIIRICLLIGVIFREGQEKFFMSNLFVLLKAKSILSLRVQSLRRICMLMWFQIFRKENRH